MMKFKPMTHWPFKASDGSFYWFAEEEIDDDGELIPGMWMCPNAIYSSQVYIEYIEWPEVIQFVCQYCGASVEPGKKCSGCQNPRPIREGSIGKAIVKLCGTIPNGLFIFDPPAKMAINYAASGRRDYFENCDLRIMINVLHVKNRVLDTPICFSPSDDQIVTLHVEVEADVSVEYPEGES